MCGFWRLKREHGSRYLDPQPTLSDSEVLAMELVGEFLGYDTDEGIYTYFRWHRLSLFPALAHVHRSEFVFVRQAARLLWVKERLWRYLLGQSPMILRSRS